MNEFNFLNMFTGEEIFAITVATFITLSFRKIISITRFLNETLSDAFSQDFFQDFKQTKSFHEHISKSSLKFDQTESENKSFIENNQQNNRIVQ